MEDEMEGDEMSCCVLGYHIYYSIWDSKMTLTCLIKIIDHVLAFSSGGLSFNKVHTF